MMKIAEGPGEGAASQPAWDEAAFQADLARALADIDGLTEFSGQPHNLPARILRKLDCLGQILARHDRPLTGTRQKDKVRSATLELIRHAGAKQSSAIKLAIGSLSKSSVARETAIRHVPERPIDLKLDDYQEIVLDRGYGAPKDAHNPHWLDRAATALDVGCEIDDLDGVATRRVKHINTLVASLSCCRSDGHEVKLPVPAARSPWG